MSRKTNDIIRTDMNEEEIFSQNVSEEEMGNVAGGSCGEAEVDVDWKKKTCKGQWFHDKETEDD